MERINDVIKDLEHQIKGLEHARAVISQNNTKMRQM
jgi:hypothetical protein